MIHKPLVIFIAGPSGSGKTTLARGLYENWGPSKITLLTSDSYYKDFSHIPFSERTKLNFDAPCSIDIELMQSHLKQLISGHAIDLPSYDFKKHNRSDDLTKIEPRPVLIVEGILILAIECLRQYANHKIYLDTQLDLCLMRRIRRDCMERGRTVESVLDQYEKTVHPMLIKYVLPSRQYATCLFEDGGPIPGVFSWTNEIIASHLSTNVS